MSEPWADWPEQAKYKLLGEASYERWRRIARPEQLPPEGEWRVWYLQGGRGSGKTRTGSETLASYIAKHGPADWGIVAPTYGDARDVCAEGRSGILAALGPLVLDGPNGWNRSLGEINLVDGSRIYLDGADDGALRIQGKNLAGCWCDEIALWKKWEMAWNESISFAVRIPPSKIIATGTPKMGHGLVRLLVEDEHVPISRLRTVDNLANLDPFAVADLQRRYGDSRLGRQELEGEYIAEIEGDLLKRGWWRYYDPALLGTPANPGVRTEQLPIFSMIVLSLDTPLKDKESSDNVALQAWGVHKADRYLLDSRVAKMGYDQCRRAVIEMWRWATVNWPHAITRVLIENAGYGVELLIDLNREISGVTKIPPGAEGNKGSRALSASGDLETGNVYVPGRGLPDLSGPDERATPAMTVSLIHEAALFQPDGSHSGHDDQVDAFSQTMNWLRTRSAVPMRTSSLLTRVPGVPGPLRRRRRVSQP